MRSRWLRGLAGLGLVALVLGVRLVLGERFEVAVLVQRLRELGDEGAALPLFALIYVVSTSAFLPSAVLHVVAGASWGFWGGLGPCLVMSNLVGHCHFAFGRLVGRDRIRELLVRRRWTLAIEELERSGVLTVLILRQTPIPFAATNLVCGASPVSWTQFAIGHFLGLLPGVVVSTWFASAIAEGLDGAREAAFRSVALAGGSVVAVALLTRLGLRWLTRRRKLSQDPA